MIKNYFKTLWRNMQKNKLHTAINVIGMAVAFTCSILLLVMVYYEFSFDKFNKNKNQLFKLYSFENKEKGAQLSSSMMYPVVTTIKAEGIGVEKATRFKYRGQEIRYKEKTLEQSAILVDDDFFSMFSFPIIKGAQQHPLASTGDVVLSEKTAINLFGSEEPIGKAIEVKIAGEWKSLIVSAVLEDAPKISSIQYSVLARTEIDPEYAARKNAWDFSNHDVYIQLAQNISQLQFEKRVRDYVKKYEPVDEDALKKEGYKKDANGDYYGMKLLPIEQLHFSAELSNGNAVSKPFLYILLLVALVIILIACFNFINLNIGLSFTRTKEMGIRKCLGAGKRQVWLQVWGESLVTVLAAIIMGITTTTILMKGFNKMMESTFDTSILYQPLVILGLLILLFLVSLMASGYPSYIMGKLKTVEILKGKISLKKPGLFRNALIVAQFAIAIVLICTTFIIYQQFQHLRKAPLGYTTTSLVSIPIKKYEKGREIVSSLRTLLASQPTVFSVTGSDINLGVGKDGSYNQTGFGFNYNGQMVRTNFMAADYDIVKTLGIKLKEGRDFSNAYVADSTNSVIITESMAKQLTDRNAVGLSFYADSSQPKWNVVGVIPDFHLYSMYQENKPLTIGFNNKAFVSYALIKVNTQNPAATMDIIKNAYAQAEPSVEFKGSYVTENIDRWYKNEKRLSNMFSIAALVAIVLSCMGLFGMAFIIIRQRVKEIGVRKVLGASVSGITTLVTKEFIKPVVVALLIATPIAWWAMHQWLQDFTYRINIQWWVFAIAGIVAVLIAILTVSFHTVKAALTNPVKSLRTE
jgi:putative ABC transport system permease protein